MSPAGCPERHRIDEHERILLRGDARKAGICDRMAEMERDMELIQQWQAKVQPDIEQMVAAVKKMGTVAEEQERAKQQHQVADDRRTSNLKMWIGIVVGAATLVHGVITILGPMISAQLYHK